MKEGGRIRTTGHKPAPVYVHSCGLFLTSLVLLMDTIKSKKGSNPARCPGEFS